MLEIPVLIEEIGKNDVLTWYCRYFYQKKNFFEAFKLLINSGINIQSVDKEGNNALQILAQHYENENLTEIIRLLIEKGIDVNSKNSRSKNALFYVITEICKTKYLLKDEVVKLLIRHGIQLSNKNYKMLQKCGIEDRNGGLEILKYMAKEDLTLGWHKNCTSCENIL
jgi:ankyrin repeat protein